LFAASMSTISTSACTVAPREARGVILTKPRLFVSSTAVIEAGPGLLICNTTEGRTVTRTLSPACTWARSRTSGLAMTDSRLPPSSRSNITRVRRSTDSTVAFASKRSLMTIGCAVRDQTPTSAMAPQLIRVRTADIISPHVVRCFLTRPVVAVPPGLT
jgi:hypothetical protein